MKKVVKINNYLLSSYSRNKVINLLKNKHGNKYIEYVPHGVPLEISETLCDINSSERNMSIFIANKLCGFNIGELSSDFNLSKSQIWRLVNTIKGKLIEQKNTGNIFLAN
jgi:Mor family transcriptional regulator